MEIKNTLLRSLDPYNRARVEQKNGDAPERAAPGQAPAARQGDRVSPSDEARLHTAARPETAAAPDVRPEQGEAPNHSAAAGPSPWDTRKVAMKLVASESLLAGTLDE